MSLNPGTVLVGKYRIDRVLGRGGMAVVFAATHVHLGEPVAIKVLHRQVLHRPGAVQRFLREARVAMRLRSDHVARVFDIGTTEDGSPFIVMEFLAGADLATILHEHGPLPLPDAVDYLLQACQALGEAHVGGVVHRDLKPANIFLCASVDGAPSVKVLDFGVSKLLVSETRPDDLLTQTAPPSEREPPFAEPPPPTGETAEESAGAITHTRAFFGSPVYMAPEQIRSARDVDARADVWALGVILYELVSGARPFAGETLEKLCARILERHAAPFRPPGGAMPELEAVFDVCLAKDPGDRYQSVRAFAEAIVRFGSADARASFERIVRITDVRSIPPPERSPRADDEPTLGSARTEADASSTAGITGPPAPARPRILRRAAFVAAFVSAGAGVVVLRARSDRSASIAKADVASAVRCASSRGCTEANGGAAARCGADGACVPLASDDCSVYAAPPAIESDDTVWFGAMLPLKGPTYGEPSLRAIDLARQDFDQMMSGFSQPRGDAHVPPFGVVACDDTKDAMRAARHLVGEVHVPAIIGFGSAAELIDVGSALLVPNGVLAVASMTTSPLATRLPTLPGQPRLVWRTTYDAAESARALGRVVPDLLEPQIRAIPRALGPGAPIRVAFVRMKSAGSTTFADLLFKGLRFNGKAASENGDSYREVTVDESDPSMLDAQVKMAALAIEAFAPHVVIMITKSSVPLMDAIEGRWTRPGPRPRYVFVTNLVNPVLQWIGRSADRRRRVFGIAPTSERAPNLRFVAHYNESSPEKTTPALAPSDSYDAFYLLAYATYALGEETVTGTGLARAIERLLPPGTPVDVGPAHIFDAYSLLRRGEKIDLNGAVGSLDFDLATGEEPVNHGVMCAALGDHGRAVDSQESGVVFLSAEDRLSGSFACP